jgi:hypothetical protein
VDVEREWKDERGFYIGRPNKVLDEAFENDRIVVEMEYD